MVEPNSLAGGAARSPDAVIDPERQTRARAYARERYRMMLVSLGLSFALIVAFLVSGASIRLRDALISAGLTNQAALVAVYVAIVLVGYTLITSPLSWWSGYVMPHRYDLSTQTPAGWLLDEVKSLVLGLVFAVPVAVAIYWLLGAVPNTWWIWASVLMIALSIVMGYLAPVLILPLFYKLVPLADADLVERIQKLAEKTGTRIAGVYTINLSSRTKAANAMVMGLSRTKRIALGDTLYADFTPDEIETIIAHELGHQVQHDLEFGTLLQVISTVVGLYIANLFLQWGVSYFGFSGINDIAALPLLALAAGIFGLITMPLSNGYSRWRESKADAYSLRVTHKPAAFISAMTRLANQNLSQLDPPRLVVVLLYSHPPIAERIAMAQQAQ